MKSILSPSRSFILTIAFGFVAIAAPARAQESNPASTASRPSTQARRRPGPCVRFTIHDPAIFKKDSRMTRTWDATIEELPEIIKESITGNQAAEEAVDHFIQFIKTDGPSLKWPVTAWMFMTQGFRGPKPVFAFLYNPANAQIWKKAVPQGALGEEGETVSVGGEQYNSWTPDRYTLLIDGRFEGRQLFVIDALDAPLDAKNEITEIIAMLRESAARDASPEKPPILKHLKGRGLELAFDAREFLYMIPKDTPVNVERIVQIVAGKNLDGVAMRVDVEGTRGASEIYVGIRVGDGLLGSLFATNPPASRTAGWVPAGADFTNFSFTTKNLDKIVNELNNFRIPTHPSGWGPAYTWISDALGDTDPVKLICNHFTGEVAIVSQHKSAETAVAGGAGDATVFLLGVNDGAKIIHWFRDEFPKLDLEVKTAAAPVKDDNNGIIVISAGGKPLGCLAAREQVLAFCPPVNASVELLKKVLATDGKAPFPAEITNRIPDIKNIDGNHIFTFSSYLGTVATQTRLQQRNMGAAVVERFVKFAERIAKIYSGEQYSFIMRGAVTSEGTTIKTNW